jgi:ABC-type transport system substrate-binding protein
VRYTYERFRTLTRNPARSLLDPVERVEALDRYTVRFTLSEPFAWFLDVLSSPAMAIVPREAVERHGDLRRADACIGTGPWMLEHYTPGVRLRYVRHPDFFRAGLPYADGVEVTVEADPSARLASWLAGQYDFAPEYGMVVRRVDLDVARRRKPGLQTTEFVWLVGALAAMKLDRMPFRDRRVRQALARAGHWRDGLAASAFADGHGVPNPAVPAAFADWSIPIAALPPEGRRLYEQDIPEARRLLGEAGHAQGVRVAVETTAGYGPDFMDLVQVLVRNWKRAGIEADLQLKEYGAFLASIVTGRFDTVAISLLGAWTEPDSYLYRLHMPGQPTNGAGVDDPKLTEMIRLQRRTFDVARRREMLHDIQRYLSTQAYYLYDASASVVAAWDAHVRNFGPNIGHDYGGRLMVAWLDR